MDIHRVARRPTPEGRGADRAPSAKRQTPKAAAFRRRHARGPSANGWYSGTASTGLAGLEDRSSRPRRLHSLSTPMEVEKIDALRRQRLTGKQIATEAGVSPATVSRVLRRPGLNKLCALEPEPARRYERENPGELIHVDIKKSAGSALAAIGSQISTNPAWSIATLGIGWEFVHVLYLHHGIPDRLGLGDEG